MKKYKRLFITLLFASALLLVVGCGKEEEKKEKNVEGTLTELMDKVNKDLPEEVQERLMSVEVSEENVQMFLGSTDIEYKEAMASENMIGSIAHSVILLRAKENADIEALKKQIKESINPRKWICVWVEDEDVIIKNKGDLIIVIIVENKENREAIDKGFDNL